MDVHAKEWICLFTQPFRERLAFSSLSEAGFHAYLPVYRKFILRFGKRVTTTMPLFPRYIFAQGSAETLSYFDARRLSGITSFAAPTLNQSFLAGEIIAQLKAKEDESGILVFDPARIKSGQSVKILDGPFANLEAVFAEANDTKRSYIILKLLGKTHKIVVSNQSLQFAA